MKPRRHSKVRSSWHPIEFLRKQEQGFDLPTKARVFKQRALQLFTYNETTENEFTGFNLQQPRKLKSFSHKLLHKLTIYPHPTYHPPPSPCLQTAPQLTT